MRVTLFHNPSAGDTSLNADQLQSIRPTPGYQVRYQSMQKDWRSALDDVGDLAIVAGGDGTVAKVAIAVADTDTPLAVLPLGTANNVGKALGVFGDAHDLVASWKGRAAPCARHRRRQRSVRGGALRRGGGQRGLRRARAARQDRGRRLASRIVHRETDRALQLLAAILRDAPAASGRSSSTTTTCRARTSASRR